MEIGPTLRKVRRARGITLKEVSQEAGLSKSFVSQVEAGDANPSIASLKRIASALDLPLATLFVTTGSVPESASTRGDATVIRRDERKMLIAPKTDGALFLLSPEDCGQLEVSFNEYQQGYDTGEEMYTHKGEECGFVLTGVLEVIVDGDTYVLEAGDSIYFSSRLPHRFRNRGPQVVTTLWVNTPRSY
jgi:transcriptional regulator with XRE-family HTH domain